MGHDGCCAEGALQGAAGVAGAGSALGEYRRRTPLSARAFARSREMHVNGVHHNIRFFEPYPFVARSALGSRIVDIDGNSYTDYWMGHWSMILGHVPRAVAEAVAAQLGRGWMHGTASEPAMGLSEAIRGAVPAAEKIRYTSTGTEAAMYAVRLARALTGRPTAAKVDGGWHGYASELLKTVNWPFDVPESGGLVDAGHVVSVPYNDLDASLGALESVRGSLACIVVEPVLGGGGCVPADESYLRGLQEFARKSGALFILDEIVTGFRLRYGCAYEAMGLDPDIVLLGKIVGGGFPIGAICGRAEAMRSCDTGPGGPERRRRSYIGGGTFSANPVTMAAGAATLRELEARGPRAYDGLGAMGGRVRDGLSRALGGRASVTGTGSLFMVHFAPGGGGGGGPQAVRSAAGAAACDTRLLRRYHFEMIARDGIFFLPGKMGALSCEHGSGDVAALLEATERFAQGL